jgi:hypothetical protein
MLGCPSLLMIVPHANAVVYHAIAVFPLKNCVEKGGQFQNYVSSIHPMSSDENPPSWDARPW